MIKALAPVLNVSLTDRLFDFCAFVGVLLLLLLFVVVFVSNAVLATIPGLGVVEPYLLFLPLPFGYFDPATRRFTIHVCSICSSTSILSSSSVSLIISSGETYPKGNKAGGWDFALEAAPKY